MRRLRIAIITPSFPPKSGGIAVSHYNLFHLLKKEYEVRAFAYDDDDPEPCENVMRRKTPSFIAGTASWQIGRAHV